LSVIKKLSSSLHRSDEIPNQELAIEIIRKNDSDAVKELVDNIFNKDRAIQNDCIKVLYEIGERGKPELIAQYVDTFIAFLSSKNNRMVWGAMIALGTVAKLKAGEIWKQIDEVIAANEKGSVITQDWGIRVLAAVSASDRVYEKKLYPYLLSFLKKCIARDVPKHAESIFAAVNGANKEDFIAVLEERQKQLTPSQMTRIRKLFRKMEEVD